ncbi:MAG: ATP phosphoribosyltransferase, partial [Flavobacteriales bacterium]|nr:ATP phosphoribosyltransferase [Flavobacteriales bacterium]
DGVVDVAIIGENLLIEKQKNIEIIERLGFSKCRVSLAVPKEIDYDSINYFEGRKIATSYPNTLLNYLNKNEVNAEIHAISGSVEIAPNIGLADGICDIVSSGSTLFKNGLKEIQVMLRSEAVLAKSPNIEVEQKQILDKLLFRMKAVLRAKNTKYVLMNLPNTKIEQVSQILPVLKSPTILPLAEEGWSSLHTVIDEAKFWDVIDELKSAGAEGILIVPIDKMVL